MPDSCAAVEGFDVEVVGSGGGVGLVHVAGGLSAGGFSEKFRQNLDIVWGVAYNDVMSKMLLLHAHHILTDNEGIFETTLRRIAKKIGFDPWGIQLRETILRATEHEQEPVSRFMWGSPCRFIRSIDIMVHVLLPAMLEDGHPTWATYLRTTSPRWGRTWRHW